jgi:hypothetical protein
VEGLQARLGAAPAQLALSDAHAFSLARSLIGAGPPELVARAVGTLAANFRRLHAKASATARNSALSPAATAAALAAAGGAALALGGRFVAALGVPHFTDKRSFWPRSTATAWSGSSCWGRMARRVRLVANPLWASRSSAAGQRRRESIDF